MKICYTSCNHKKCWTILLKMTGNIVGPNSVITLIRTLPPFEVIRTSHRCNVCLYRAICQ